MAVRGPIAKSARSLVPHTHEDERLLVEAAQKNPSRFGELYERNFERVYAYVARRVPDRHEAEDVTADVFYRALANLSRFEWRGVPFVAWLLTIASNVLADRWKHGAKRSRDVAAADQLPDAGVASPQQIEEIEQRAMLFRLVHKLPQIQRRVVELRFAGEKSIREVASELGRSEGAVKQLQFRALQNLRVQLEKSGEANG